MLKKKAITIFETNGYKISSKNESVRNIINISLLNIIKIKCVNYNFYELHEIIDCALYIHKNNKKLGIFKKRKNTNKKIDVLSYFCYEYIKNNRRRMPLIRSLIILEKKKRELLDTYFRITNNNYFLLCKIFNNKQIILKSVNKDIQTKTSFLQTINVNNDVKDCNNDNSDSNYNDDDSNDVSNDDSNDNSNDDSNDDVKDGNDDVKDGNDIYKTDSKCLSNNNYNPKFCDIKNIINKNLKKVEIIKNIGYQSNIEFYLLEDNIHNEIQNKIKTNIDNCIVKKKFIDVDEKVTLYFDGKTGQYNREVNGLLSVYKEKHFPILLSKNDKTKTIFMNYCGEPLCDTNIPSNWKEQLNTIISTLISSHCSNNDMWKNNFLVKDNIIHLVDFGWSTIDECFPYINITTDDVNSHDGLFSLLDSTFERVIDKRLLFSLSL